MSDTGTCISCGANDVEINEDAQCVECSGEMTKNSETGMNEDENA